MFEDIELDLKEDVVVNEVVVNDYTKLDKKPQINNVELEGNKTLEELGIQPIGNYVTNEEIDKQGFIGIGTLEFKEPNETCPYYAYPLGADIGKFGEVYNNNESIEIIWDGVSYILEPDNDQYSSNWGNLEDFPCYLSLASERIFTNDTSKYHKVIVKDIRGNILVGNTIPSCYLNLPETKDCLEENNFYIATIPVNNGTEEEKEKLSNVFTKMYKKYKDNNEDEKYRYCHIINNSNTFSQFNIYIVDLYELSKSTGKYLQSVFLHEGVSCLVRNLLNIGYVINDDNSITITKANSSTSKTDIIAKDNTEFYEVKSDYNPAHKKYVDNAISTVIGDINTILATLTTVSEVSE